MKGSEIAALHMRAYDFAAGLKAALAAINEKHKLSDEEFSSLVSAHWLAHVNADLMQYSHDWDLLEANADDELMQEQLTILNMGVETEQMGAQMGRDMAPFITKTLLEHQQAEKEGRR